MRVELLVISLIVRGSSLLLDARLASFLTWPRRSRDFATLLHTSAAGPVGTSMVMVPSA